MKRIAFVALLSRRARAAGLLPGEHVLVGDLRDGTSVGELQRLLATGALEVEVLPAPTPAVVPAAPPAPAPSTMEKPRPSPAAAVDAAEPVVIENAAITPRVVNDPAAEEALREAVAKDEAAKPEATPEPPAPSRAQRKAAAAKGRARKRG